LLPDSSGAPATIAVESAHPRKPSPAMGCLRSSEGISNGRGQTGTLKSQRPMCREEIVPRCGSISTSPLLAHGHATYMRGMSEQLQVGHGRNRGHPRNATPADHNRRGFFLPPCSWTRLRYGGLEDVFRHSLGFWPSPSTRQPREARFGRTERRTGPGIIKFGISSTC